MQERKNSCRPEPMRPEELQAIEEKERKRCGDAYPCVFEVGRFGRFLMEKYGLLRHAGKNGKTRIVIEYDNDTGEGWKWIAGEVNEQISIPKDPPDAATPDKKEYNIFTGSAKRIFNPVRPLRSRGERRGFF